MKKFIYVLGISVLLILSLSACSKVNNKEKNEQNFITMDTPMRLIAYGPNAKKAVDESVQRLNELNDMASSNISTSDISKINNAAGKSPVKVHSETIKMLVTSQKYSELSDGKWDISVGPLINLWGIGTDKARIPSDTEIKAKLPLVGYKKIIINEKDSTVMLKDSGMSIDLGGIAKGFAADEVLSIYKKYDIKDGLIDLGSSSIYTLGKTESNNPWSIGIKHPRNETNGNYLGIIKISDEGLSTSGDYERFFVKDGKRYHHILDPATGYPVDNGIMSVTVVIDGSVKDNGMLADILSLTVFELGIEKGIKFIDSIPNVACEITTTDYKVYTSSGFKGKISNLNNDFKFAN